MTYCRDCVEDKGMGAVRLCPLHQAAPALLAALQAAQRLFAEALPKFNWGASALDANATDLLNSVPIQARAAIAAAK